MKPQNQAAPQDDQAQLLMETRRDILQFDDWLKTAEGQRWLDAEEQEDLARRCLFCWEA